MASKPLGIVILISGRGSNMKAIIKAAERKEVPVEVRAVISNDPDAAGLDTAREAGLNARALDHRNFSDREAFDAALIEMIDEFQPELVVLAGFMRILGESFVNHYAGRLMNIHPALLPAFPGLNTHERALAAGVNKHGATVHFVTHDVDVDPIIVYAAVNFDAADSVSTLPDRGLQ